MLVLALGYKLESVPRGFDGDEAAVGYYAYSLLHFGTDEFGNKFPLFFRSIGDYKFPGYSYLSIISVGIFGLSVATTRALSAIAGIGTVLVVIYWIKRDILAIDSSRRFILIPLLAISSPWFLVFSRSAREANLGLFLMTAGLCLIFDKSKGLKKLSLAAGLLFTAAMTYPAYRLVGFLLLLLAALLEFVDNKKKVTVRVIFVAVLGIVLMGLSLDPRSRVRAGGLLVGFENTEVKDALQSQIWEMGMVSKGSLLGISFSRVFDNKVFHLGVNLLGRYLQNFDPNYLFLKGNPNLPWYNVVGTGVLGLILLPLIILGLASVVKEKKGRTLWALVIGWLLVSALPSALTVETPNQIRGLSAWPPFLMLAIMGLYRVKSKWLLFLISLLIFVNSIYALKQFFIHREYHRPWYSDQGMKEVVNYVLDNHTKYKKIAIGNDPYIFFLFWGTKDRQINQKFLEKNDSKWNSVTSVGNVFFNMPINCPKVGMIGVLYICKGSEIPQNAVVKKAVYFNDGVPAYSAIEFYPISQIESPRRPLPDRFTYMVEADGRNDGLILEDENRLW